MSNIYIAKCESCGETNYIFPDQIQKIKENDNLALHKFCKDKLRTGSPWFCIKCDSGDKNPHDCKIISELPSGKSKKLIDIRKRETNLKAMDFYLPNLY